jgi:RNA polymerase sigma-70 factor (ECF subfamily)
VDRDEPFADTGVVPCASPRPDGEPGMRSLPTRDLPTGRARLGELLEALRPRLLAVATHYTRDAAAADDVVQNAFEKAIRGRDGFRGQARVSTWLHRIVTNEALMWLRSEGRRRARFDAMEAAPAERLVGDGPDPAEDLERRDEAQAVRAAVAGLRREERDVVERCLLAGCGYGEYGRAMGIHPAAAKSRAFRARRRLRTRLARAGT